MARATTCPDCGTELTSERGTEGLCPRCLLSLALVDFDLGVEDQPTLTLGGAGRILGQRYQLRDFLGRGGMGEVWRAFDLKLRVDVALKFIRPERAESAKARELLRQEVRAARQVMSANVCRIYDLVVEDGEELVSMEYIDGTTLAATMQERGPLGLEEAREIASQFLLGLEAIHQAGLVHRDFKPENVMLTRAGRVVVMDFGLAKGRTEAGTGSRAGTPAYMAPEQDRGEAVDPRADVFAAGIVLAEMLATGDDGGQARQRLFKAVREAPPQVPEGPWAPILRQALSADPRGRHASAGALARALEEVTLRLPGFEQKHPYPGLASFTEEDAEFFFGRELEVEALWRKIKRPRLLALIGPSGAGKSSFLRAGLMPTLPEGWRCVVCTPGASPMMALAQALAPELAGQTEAVRDLLRFEDAEVAVDLVARWRHEHDEALVIVDQFEELFTLNRPEIQARFADLLGRLAVEADVHVLLSMRDDFLFQCHPHPALSPILSELTLLGPPGGAALRRALVQPALKCGYRFEDDGLVDEMLQEVTEERAALPPLAFTMAQLWERRDRQQGLLTREAYKEIGGVGGALARHAEATLERIGAERQSLVREVFRNLVTAQGTRAARDMDELLSVFEERGPAEEVLMTLIDARLLTSFEDRAAVGEEASHRRQVEIVHESLLTSWPRLVRWQTQDEEGALLRDQLRQAARLWEEKSRTADLLWTGTAYQEFELWRARYPGRLTVLEEDFARAMADKARRKRRLMRLAVGIAFVLITAIALAIGVSRQQATRARDQARAEALRAEASKLLALAELRLRDDPTEALAFTTASLEQTDTREARVFAMKALWEAPPAFELNVESQAAKFPVFSPDGKWLAAAGHDSTARVWSEDGRTSLVLPGHETSPRGGNRACWASNDLLVTGDSPWVASGVYLWSIPAGRRVRTIDFGRPSQWRVGWQRLFAATLESGSTDRPGVVLLRSWALPGGEPAVLGRVDRGKLGAQMTSFEPSGKSWLYARDRNLYARPLPIGTGPDRLFARLGAEFAGLFAPYEQDQLVVHDKAGQTHVWSFPPRGAARERVISRPDTASIMMRPDRSGRWLSGDPNLDQQARLWDLTAWAGARPRALRRSGSWYIAMTGFHPTGDWLVASTSTVRRLTFWPLGRAYPTVVDGYTEIQRPVAFSPDGKWLATSWGDLRLRLWPLPGSGGSEVRTLDLPERPLWTGLAFDPQSRYLFAVGNQDRSWIVPLDGSAPRKLQGFSEDTMLMGAAVSPSGRRVATAFFYGGGEKTLRVWDLETGELRRFDLPAGQGSANGANQAGPAPTGYERGINSLAFANETTLYTGGARGLRRWNLEDGSHEVVAAASPGHPMMVSLSADGRVALTLDDEDCPRARFHDLTTGTSRLLWNLQECDIRSVVVDPSGTVAAAGSDSGIIRVGRLSGGHPHLLVGHKGPAGRVAISPDLRWVATAGQDNTLRLWPMPDLSKPPLHALPHDELLARLRSLTNLRSVKDPGSATGWKVEVGPFPGWKDVPTW